MNGCSEINLGAAARRDQKGVMAVTGKAIQARLDFIIADASGP